MTTPAPAPAGQDGNGTRSAAPGVELATVQLRALRFESQLGLGEAVSAPPEVAVAADYQQRPLANGTFAALLRLRALGRAGARPLFTATVEQSAIVRAAGLPTSDAAAWVARRAPARIYPFARQALEELLGNSQFTGFRLSVTCPPLEPLAAAETPGAGSGEVR